ncbi:YadA-like family protein [Dyella sp. 2RAB6]|uniref:YadA-like family protein n=1 Tax=Dyella sp. 2RAB6 TaxID=3232992 RepID=UPI003F932B7E
MSHSHPIRINPIRIDQHSKAQTRSDAHPDHLATLCRTKNSDLFALGFGALALWVSTQATANVIEVCDGNTATTITAGSTAKVGKCNDNGQNSTTFLLASNGDGVAVHGHSNGTLTLRGNNGVSIRGNTSLNGHRITSLAAGSADADAVNVGQLRPLQNSLQRVDGALGTLDRGLSAANGNISNLSSGLDTAKNHITDINTHLDTAKGKIATLSTGVDTAHSSITQLHTGLGTANANLTRLIGNLDNGSAGLVRQAGKGDAIDFARHLDSGRVNFAGGINGKAADRVLAGVAAGAADNDAVNMKQLKHIAGALGGGAVVNAAGDIVQPTYNIQGQNRTGVDGALSALDGGLDTANAQIARLDSSLGNGSAGLLRQNGKGEDVTLAKELDGNKLNIAGTFDEPTMGGGTAKQIKDRGLTGLAAGKADNDAVNLGQLKETGLFDNAGGARHAVTYDSASKSMVTFGGVGGTVLANVAPGQVAADSRQAINGGQLHALREDLHGRLHGLDGRVGKLETPADGDGDHSGTPGISLADSADQTASDGLLHAPHDSIAISDRVPAHGSDASTGSATHPRQITHVAAGTQRTDAANWGQVQDAVDDVRHWAQRRFEQLDRRVQSIGAMSAAMAQMAFSAQGLAQVNRVAVGVGRQGNRSAVALGYSHQWQPNMNLSLGGALSGDDASMGAGFALGW